MKNYQLGESIRYFRLLKGLKQRAFAKKIGVSVITISKWENGRAAISTNNLSKVANCLQIPETELFEKPIGQTLNNTAKNNKTHVTEQRECWMYVI